MRKETFELTGFGGVKLPAVLWLPQGKTKATLQIAHGMTEHMGRYDAMAQALTDRGIAVAGFDLRGHGQNGGNAHVASLGEGGWAATLEDMRCMASWLSARFAGVPHAMLGFSLGSFLLREYLDCWPQGVACAAILGTGQQPDAVLGVLRALVKGQIKKAGFDASTPLVRKLSFETYNQKWKPNRTAADWLCADETQLDGYLRDPLCREEISAGLFYDLLGGMQRTGRKGACSAWKKDMSVLLLSGAEDPVGGMGKGVTAVKRQLDASGLEDVTLTLLPGARHDVLHEQACGAAQEAMELLAAWLESRCGA